MATKRFIRRDDVREETPAPAPAEPVAPPADPVVAEIPLPVAATEQQPPPVVPEPPSGLVVVRVRGPGAVMTDTMHLAGDEMVMNLGDALSLGDAVEIVG
jgi:hypothetical protein